MQTTGRNGSYEDYCRRYYPKNLNLASLREIGSVTINYLPVQRGLRFSANAFGPSTKSCDVSSRCRRGRSWRMASSMGRLRPPEAPSLWSPTLKGDHSLISLAQRSA